jgi:hypothetical protein
MRFLTSGFFHESVSPKPLSISIDRFEFFQNVHLVLPPPPPHVTARIF